MVINEGSLNSMVLLEGLPYTVTLHSSAFQGTKWFYALEWKCLRANIESTTESDEGIF